jgi:DNA-binding PucR family transcriptional regulator
LTVAPHIADPALVELVLSEREAPVDRSRALRLMGFDPVRPLRVLAFAIERGGGSDLDSVMLLTREHLQGAVRSTVFDGVVATLLQRADSRSPSADLRAALERRRKQGSRTAPHGVVVGIGGSVTGLAAFSSWTQARRALHFAATGARNEAVVDYEGLGALAMIAELPADRLRQDPDVMAIAALPDADVDALEAFCRYGSLRQAAASLHLHHSSVAARLARVEETLELRLDDPIERFRVTLALLARRVLSAP